MAVSSNGAPVTPALHGAFLNRSEPVTPSLENERGEHHVEGDLMTVAASKLGRLTNRMRPSGACEAWEFGLTALIAALTRRAQDKSK